MVSAARLGAVSSGDGPTVGTDETRVGSVTNGNTYFANGCNDPQSNDERSVAPPAGVSDGDTAQRLRVVPSETSASSFYSAEEGDLNHRSAQDQLLDHVKKALVLERVSTSKCDSKSSWGIDTKTSSPNAFNPPAVVSAAVSPGKAIGTSTGPEPSEGEGNFSSGSPCTYNTSTAPTETNGEALNGSPVNRSTEVSYVRQLRKVSSTITEVDGELYFVAPHKRTNNAEQSRRRSRRSNSDQEPLADQQLDFDTPTGSEAGESDAASTSGRQELGLVKQTSSGILEVDEFVSGMVPRPASPLKRQGCERDEWWQREVKHVFVLTSSGKPVYTYRGDESALAGFMAVVQAMISVVKDNSDELQTVRAGRRVFVFLERGPFYLVAVSALQEAPAVLSLQLSLLYEQLVMILSGAVDNMVKKNPRFDVRNLLGGTDTVLRNLISSFLVHPAALMVATPMQPLDVTTRQAATAALEKAVKDGGGLYGVMLCHPSLISSVHPPGQPLHPHDLLLIDNFVNGTQSFRQAQESFSPLCLPHVNSMAFFHAYIRYIDPHQRVAVVIIAAAADLFYSISEAVTQMTQHLNSSGCMKGLCDAVDSGSGCVPLTTLPPLPALSGTPTDAPGPLLHWAYKHIACSQMIMAQFEGVLKDVALQQAITSTYGRARQLLINCKLGAPPHRMLFEASNQWVVLTQMSASFELYVVLDPLTDKSTASQIATRLSSWIKSSSLSFFQPK